MDNNDCPEELGTECGPTGFCEVEDLPGSECLSSSECPPSFGCGEGYCLRCQGNGNRCNECETDADCGGATRCNPFVVACLSCVEDADCNVAGGEVCHPYGDCDLPCNVDADCSANRVCDEFNRCVPPQTDVECVFDADCPGAAQCLQTSTSAYCVNCETDGMGNCIPCQPGNINGSCTGTCDHDAFVCVACNEDADCVMPNQTCTEQGSCVDPCFADVDCPVGLVCNLGYNRCELP